MSTFKATIAADMAAVAAPAALCILCFVWFRSRRSVSDILPIQESGLRHRLTFCVLFGLKRTKSNHEFQKSR